MESITPNPVEETTALEDKPKVRSLRELIDLVSGKNLQVSSPEGDSGLAEPLPFPFLALVGQPEMKLALMLAIINPGIGGVLLLGARGTGKTTAVRSLLELLPEVTRSHCFYGCLPEDIETGGIDAVCPDCARRYAEGQPLTITDQVRMVELPLNASMEDVVGGIDERALIHERLRLHRGILAHADQNLLYTDEVNLLEDEIVNAILDAAAQGQYIVRRGVMTAAYRARFVLVGSMNPEEGHLRPQIMDRFGLRVIVRGLEEADLRLDAYRRVFAYRKNARAMAIQYQEETTLARQEIIQARRLLPQVSIDDQVSHAGIHIIQSLRVDSLRAEITMFEAARAYAAADNRTRVELGDLQQVAPMALRLRRSQFMADYLTHQNAEEEQIQSLLTEFA
jgi:magnesium chelatase subunit I